MPLTFAAAARRGFAALAFLAAGPLWAGDLALVLANSDYARIEDARDARDLRPLVRRLEDEGFEVISAFEARTGDMLEAAESFRRRAGDADRILILLDGHFVSSNTDSWLLARDARDIDLMNVPSQGLSLSGLAEIAGNAAAGRAVILVGRSGELSNPEGGLRSGTQGMDLPQGVTLARGTTDQITRAIFAGLLREGESLNEALLQLSARGFLSDSVGYSEGFAPSGPQQPPVDTGAITARALEEGFWDAVRALDTAETLNLYIQRYPRGRFVRDARNRIAALEADQANRWEREEAALNLSRADRTGVQRDLTLLGYNTRGIDGIFGQGSRSAITNWQRDRGYERTGFLTRRQWVQITDEADRRRKEQADEARTAEDRYWQNTGADGSIDGLSAYLERYPRGRYAEEARKRLDALEEANEDNDRREARRAWRQAQDADTLEAYRDFLKRYPDSRFADDARKRIQDLAESDTKKLIEAAREQEGQIVNNPITRLLVEQRLAQLGYNPGTPDGNFTEQTRAAIKRFQRERGIFESGYVTNRTAGLLLQGR